MSKAFIEPLVMQQKRFLFIFALPKKMSEKRYASLFYRIFSWEIWKNFFLQPTKCTMFIVVLKLLGGETPKLLSRDNLIWKSLKNHEWRFLT